MKEKQMKKVIEEMRIRVALSGITNGRIGFAMGSISLGDKSFYIVPYKEIGRFKFGIKIGTFKKLYEKMEEETIYDYEDDGDYDLDDDGDFYDNLY